MKNESFFTSTCRCCAYFSPEGRRGGACKQLGVSVRGCWKACSLGVPAFARQSEGDRIGEQIVHLEHSLALNLDFSADSPEVGLPSLDESSNRETATAA